MKIVKASNGKTRITLSKKEWENIGKKVGWIKIAQKYLVVDNPFNRKNYSDIIGNTYDSPPAYAHVELINDQPQSSDIKLSGPKLNTKLKDNFGHELYARLEDSKYVDGKVVQLYKSKNDFHIPSGWPVKTIIDNSSDTIYIDMGQNWYVQNIQELINEIKAKNI